MRTFTFHSTFLYGKQSWNTKESQGLQSRRNCRCEQSWLERSWKVQLSGRKARKGMMVWECFIPRLCNLLASRRSCVPHYRLLYDFSCLPCTFRHIYSMSILFVVLLNTREKSVANALYSNKKLFPITGVGEQTTTKTTLKKRKKISHI